MKKQTLTKIGRGYLIRRLENTTDSLRRLINSYAERTEDIFMCRNLFRFNIVKYIEQRNLAVSTKLNVSVYDSEVIELTELYSALSGENSLPITQREVAIREAKEGGWIE